MTSAKWLLLVLEDGIFHEESIRYTMNLAERMDCSVSVFMAVYDKPGDRQFKDERTVLEEIIDLIKSRGITVTGKMNPGDKASEFLKHLASNPPFGTIIWGGIEEIKSGNHGKKTGDWFSKIKNNIRCPVVRPEVKDRNKEKN